MADQAITKRLNALLQELDAQSQNASIANRDDVSAVAAGWRLRKTFEHVKAARETLVELRAELAALELCDPTPADDDG